MRTARTITASLTAVLAAAALAGPAAAVPADAHNQPNGWYAGKSTIQGSLPSDSSRDPATAIVRQGPPADVPSSGFDWGSGGIGAAAGIGAFAIAIAGTAGMRRRRVARPPSATSH
jgi:hypothetical protein